MNKKANHSFYILSIVKEQNPCYTISEKKERNKKRGRTVRSDENLKSDFKKKNEVTVKPKTE